MNILITGSTGFVGSNVVKEFQKRGVNVIGTTRNLNEIGISGKFETRYFDFEKPINYEELLTNIDVVCHAASWATMWGHKDEEFKKFYSPSIKLIDEAKRRGIKRFILTSTISANARCKGIVKDNLPGKKYSVWPHLDYLIDLENHLNEISNDSFKTVSLRLGHFIGPGNRLGLIPGFLPRLKTHIVPWIAGGQGIVPLIGPLDIANSFVLTSTMPLESNAVKINVVSQNSPSMKELLIFIHKQFNYPIPFFSVPYWFAYLFAYISEIIANVSGTTPFLSRALVHLSENWQSDNKFIKNLGFESKDDWKLVVKEHVEFLKKEGISFSLQNN